LLNRQFNHKPIAGRKNDSLLNFYGVDKNEKTLPEGKVFSFNSIDSQLIEGQ